MRGKAARGSSFNLNPELVFQQLKTLYGGTKAESPLNTSGPLSQWEPRSTCLSWQQWHVRGREGEFLEGSGAGRFISVSLMCTKPYPHFLKPPSLFSLLGLYTNKMVGIFNTPVGCRL